MSAAPVQDAHANSSSASVVSVTLGSNTTAGNTAIASICLPSGASVKSFTDTLGDPWIQCGFAESAGGNVEIWTSRGIAAGSLSASVVLSGNITAGVNVAEFSGLWYVDPLDNWQQASVNIPGDPTVPTSFAQPRTTGELCIAIVSSLSAITGPPTGFTTLAESGSSGYAAAYSVLSTEDLVEALWSGNATAWATIGAVFLPGPAGMNPRLQFPEVLVQISTDPDYLDPIVDNGEWTNISHYVRNMTLGPIGRQHELDRIQATTAQIVVDNRVDGTFNPWNTDSFLFNPDIGATVSIMSPIKVTAAWNGITQDIFYGYVQALTPTLGDALNTDVQISAVDILQMLSLKYLSNDNYAQAVLSDGPLAYYRLGDDTTSFAVQDFTNAHLNGSIVDSSESPAFGAIGPFLYDVSTALDLTNGTNLPGGGFTTNDRSVQPPTIQDPLGGASTAWSFECWFQWTGTAIPAPATNQITAPTVEVVGAALNTVRRNGQPAVNSRARRAVITTLPAITLPSATASVAAVPNGVLADFTASVRYEFQFGYDAIVGESGGLPHTPIFFGFNNSFIIAGPTGSGIWTWTANPLDGNWHHLVVAAQPVGGGGMATTIPVGSGPTGLAVSPDGLSAYVVNNFDDTLDLIDTTTSSVAASVSLGGTSPSTIALTPNGSTAYIGCNGFVDVVDTATLTVTGTIGSTPSGTTGCAVTPDGSKVYIAYGAIDIVGIYDTATNALSASVGVPGGPSEIIISPDGLHAYIANNAAHAVSVLSTISNTLVASVGVANFPFGLAITPDGAFVYVCGSSTNFVSVMNTTTNLLISDITVGNSPVEIAMSPDGKTAYVTNNSDATISIIDIASNTVTDTISVGNGPFGIAVSPLDGSIWVANQFDDTVTELSAAIVTGIDVYLDGVLAQQPKELAIPASFVDPISFTIGTTPPDALGIDPLGGTNFAQGFPGILSDVAFYDVQLTQTQVQNHYQVGKWFQSVETGASVETATGGRFNKVMEVAGLDASKMLIIPYPWLTVLYAETNVITTTSALNYMQTTTQSEPGLIYQGPDGLIYALNREYQYINPTSVTSQGLFADAASVQLHYDGPSLQIVQDDLDTWSDVQVQSGASGDLNSNFFAGAVGNASGAVLQEWGPTQSANAALSAQQYGSRTLQGLTSLQMQNDSDALAIAQNYGAWYNFPVQRVTQMTINSQGAGGNNIPQMIGRRIYDRITVQYKGQTAGPPFQQDALIESITHDIQMENGPTWQTTFALSPYEILLEPFYADVSATDGTAVLVL